MRRGKHASRRIKIFSIKRGKHAKDDMIVYNPIYARFSACISSIAVTTSLLTCLSFGRYKETIATSDVTRVSKHLLNLTSEQLAVEEFIPETTRSFNFNVSNFEGEINNPTAKNEVALKYLLNIKVSEITNIPFDYILYRVSENGVEEQIELVDGKSNWIEVSTISENHSYRLDLIWKQNKKDLKYQDLTDYIDISIEFEQIDK